MRINTSFFKSGKYKKGDIGLDMSLQRCGYNWFFYFPHINWNKGTWKDSVTDWSIMWLCYGWNITIWWKY